MFAEAEGCIELSTTRRLARASRGGQSEMIHQEKTTKKRKERKKEKMKQGRYRDRCQ